MESNISRDHIAMEAMRVLLNKTTVINPTLIDKIKALFVRNYYKVNLLNYKLIAEHAYKYAEAMIAEREKEK